MTSFDKGKGFSEMTRVLQNLIKCFNGTIVLTSFMLSFSVLPTIFVLNLNEVLLLLLARKSITTLLAFKAGSSQ